MENIIKIKPNYIEGLKNLTKLLVKPKLTNNEIEEFIELYKLDSSIIRRIFSYIFSMPSVLLFFNKHLNNLGTKLPLVEFIKTFRYVLKQNNCLDSRLFLYTKREAEDIQPKILDLFKSYFSQVHNLDLNQRELKFFYQLYLVGVITNQNIHEIDRLINNNETSIKLPNLTPIEEPEINIPISDLKTSEFIIDKLNSDLYNRKIQFCKNRKCLNRDFVKIDGNIKTLEELDVLLINLFPTISEYINHQIFKNDSSIRQGIKGFDQNIHWLLINLIPCAFKSKSEIGKADIVRTQFNYCWDVVRDLIKELNPKITLLIGEEVTDFLTQEKFEVGKIIQDKYIPIFHPNSLRGATNKPKNKECWEFIYSFLNNHKSSTIETPKEITQVTKEVVEEKEEDTSKSQDKTKLLYDIKELQSGEILMIYTDSEGNKIYETKPNFQSGFIKTSNFNECSVLTKDVNFEFRMNQKQKSQLLKLLRLQQAELKNVVNNRTR